MARPWPRRLVTLLLIAVAFGFLAREIARNFDAVRGFDWQLRPGMLVLSLLVLVSVLGGGVAYWALLLRSFGLRVPFVPLARTWFLANLSRYIPGGTVWQFVSLGQLGSGAGLTPVVSITSLLVQMGFMLVAAATIGLLILPASPLASIYPVAAVLRWATPLALVAVHPLIIRTLVNWMGRLSRRATVEWRGSWLEGLGLLVLAGLLWFGQGLAFHLFLTAFVDLPIALLPASVAINALAFLVGYLAFFAPAGLGFKDAALALLLAGLMPTSVAASLAVVARLWSIAAEVIPALLLVPGAMRAPPRPSDGVVPP